MAPTEKENVQALLKGCDRSDVAPLVTAALSNITEGVCRPLRVRLEQVPCLPGRNNAVPSGLG